MVIDSSAHITHAGRDPRAQVEAAHIPGPSFHDIDTIKDPAAALKIMKSRDPMMKEDIEKVRLDIALGLTYTDWVTKNGLSVVQRERLQRTIDSVAAAYGLSSKPRPEDVYTDKFLPPVAQRMVK